MIIFIKKSFLFTPTINDLIDAWGIYLILEFQEGAFYREEKSLCHIAMVAEFLDDKPKMSLKKSEFVLFQTWLILFSFI